MSGFYVASNSGYNGVSEFTALGALSVRLRQGSLVLMAVCSVFHI